MIRAGDFIIYLDSVLKVVRIHESYSTAKYAVCLVAFALREESSGGREIFVPYTDAVASKVTLLRACQLRSVFDELARTLAGCTQSTEEVGSTET